MVDTARIDNDLDREVGNEKLDGLETQVSPLSSYYLLLSVLVQQSSCLFHLSLNVTKASGMQLVFWNFLLCLTMGNYPRPFSMMSFPGRPHTH